MANNFLDFYNIVVNELVGDPTIFIVITLFLVTLALIKSRAPSQVYILVLFAVTGMLAIEFVNLRWLIALFVGLMAGWLIYARLRRE